jgi:hypothetical protein
MDKETALSILQAAIAGAGLLLVFSGFLIARAGDFEGNRRGDKFIVLAKVSVVPVVMSLVCAWLCLGVIDGSNSGIVALVLFKISLVLTALYAIVALLWM